MPSLLDMLGTPNSRAMLPSALPPPPPPRRTVPQIDIPDVSGGDKFMAGLSAVLAMQPGAYGAGIRSAEQRNRGAAQRDLFGQYRDIMKAQGSLTPDQINMMNMQSSSLTGSLPEFMEPEEADTGRNLLTTLFNAAGTQSRPALANTLTGAVTEIGQGHSRPTFAPRAAGNRPTHWAPMIGTPFERHVYTETGEPTPRSAPRLIKQGASGPTADQRAKARDRESGRARTLRMGPGGWEQMFDEKGDAIGSKAWNDMLADFQPGAADIDDAERMRKIDQQTREMHWKRRAFPYYAGRKDAAGKAMEFRHDYNDTRFGTAQDETLVGDFEMLLRRGRGR